MRALAGLGALALVSACSDDAVNDVAPTPTTEPSVAAAPVVSAPAAAAVLESRDCREVVNGYIAALGSREFSVAARFWADARVDAAKLAENFASYPHLAITVLGLEQEGAAGSLYCTADVVIDDVGPTPGQGGLGDIVLRRVNDVDGATPEQLRWTIRSSSLGPVLAH